MIGLSVFSIIILLIHCLAVEYHVYGYLVFYPFLLQIIIIFFHYHMFSKAWHNMFFLSSSFLNYHLSTYVCSHNLFIASLVFMFSHHTFISLKKYCMNIIDGLHVWAVLSFKINR